MRFSPLLLPDRFEMTTVSVYPTVFLCDKLVIMTVYSPSATESGTVQVYVPQVSPFGADEWQAECEWVPETFVLIESGSN